MTPSISKVVSPATSQALISLATVKRDIGIASGDTTNDDILGDLISRVSVQIAQYCNRPLVSETVEDTFLADRDPYPYQTPGGVNGLSLARWPVTSVMSVVENSTALVADTDFVIDPASGIVWRIASNGFRVSWPSFNVVVRYVGGLASNAIPFDIQDAAIRLIKGRWYARLRDPLLKSEDIPGVRSAQYWVDTGASATGAMPPDVVDLLDNYRTPVVG